MSKLKQGDRVYFLSPTGRKLRAKVVDSLDIKARGSDLLVPVVRIFNRKHPHCAADRHVEPRIRWFDRKDLRKLPPKP